VRQGIAGWLQWVVPPVVFAAVYLLLAGFGHEKAIIGAIFGMTVALWITELLPLAVTALLGISLLILVGGVKEKVAFSALGEQTIPLFIGSFLLAKAMELSGLGRRFAYSILSMRWANRSPSSLLLALGVVSVVISLLVSNTATTAMLLPIGLAILAALGEDHADSKYATAVMLMLTWGSSVAVGLPVGTPPTLLAFGQIPDTTGVRISFVDWMRFGMPITLATLGLSWGILWLLYGRGAPSTAGAADTASAAKLELGPMRPSEKAVLVAFAVALTLWIVPDLAGVILGTDHAVAEWAKERLTAAVAAIVAAALLFLLPARDRESGRALTWSEGAKIDWGVILLFAGGIALGQALFQSGLAKDLGEMGARLMGTKDVWTLTGLMVATSIVLSELASNTAAATVLIPVAIGLAQGAGVDPVPPALGAAIGSSFGFMLPVSTAPNAIVYSSGLVPSREMMKAGLLLDILSAATIWLLLRVFLPTTH
jgi:sodium-dependent dicarboxylate transporter 2/3/5